MKLHPEHAESFESSRHAMMPESGTLEGNLTFCEVDDDAPPDEALPPAFRNASEIGKNLSLPISIVLASSQSA